MFGIKRIPGSDFYYDVPGIDQALCLQNWASEGIFNGKSTDGVYQHLINRIPPHTIYIELCVGQATINRAKRPAMLNLLVDVDPQINRLYQNANIPKEMRIQGYRADCVAWLKHTYPKIPVDPQFPCPEENIFIFIDPPTDKDVHRKKNSNRHLMPLDSITELCRILVGIKCKVMLTTFVGSIYDGVFENEKGWHRELFTGYSANPDGSDEVILTNYVPDEDLHDYSFCGTTPDERARIRKQNESLVAVLKPMSLLERRAFFQLCLDNELFGAFDGAQ